MCHFTSTTMKRIIILSVTILFASCGQDSDKKTIHEVRVTESNIPSENVPVEIGLEFINSYVANCNKVEESVGVVEWVNGSNMVTKRFKKELKTIVDEAYKANPEMGLDADPIFDAQDYPDKGLELESFDSKTNFIVVKGKEWADFKLTMKMVLENDNWLVDGCGIINVPNGKRIAR